MKKELETVRKDIEDLEHRLFILREREEAIRSKIDIPKEWIGKYVKETNNIYAYYIRIDSIERAKNGTFLAKGPAIDVCIQSKGIRYNLYSNHAFCVNIDDTLHFITKEEFEAELEEAFKKFK